MPTTIDNKIVELKFDNADFEKNTKQSMATLEKLKASLDMTDSERSFDKITRASDELSFRKASDSADTFSVKLSAMSAVAVSAIGRIVNSLMDMGTQLLRTMSGIDHISAGFSKYEDIIGYQQTMLANAKNLSEGQMQELLDKLVWFADETSFSADSMMQAMSSYISAGADELTAQAAALGTALWAALTGNSNESLMRANYNLPQIFGKGYMQMQDWQSIVGAKMDAPWIRDLFIETAAELGTLQKKADGFYTTIGKKTVKVDASTFTGTFQGGWLNTKVLLKTFEKMTKFTDKVYERTQETGELAFDVIKELGKGMDDIGYKALKMAQETKTWTEAWTYIQGALTAGWTTTFETIFGSYNTAKEFFSKIVESLYSIFLTPGARRNNLLKGWAEYVPEIEGGVHNIAKDISDAANKVDKVSQKLEGVRDIVISIIRGNYGNGAPRVAALAEKYGAEAGRELQLVVNQVWKQWDGKTWSLNYELLDKIAAKGIITTKTANAVKAAAKKIDSVGKDILEAVGEEGLPDNVYKKVDGAWVQQDALLNGRDDFLDGLSALMEGIANITETTTEKIHDALETSFVGLSAEKIYGFTHRIAEAFREFRDKTEDYEGNGIRWFVYSLKELYTIVTNIIRPFKEAIGAFKDAFVKTFFPDGADARKFGMWLFDFLQKIRKITDNFKLTEEQVGKLSNIFQGLLTPIKIVWKIISSIGSAIGTVIDKVSKKSDNNSIFDRFLDIGEKIAGIFISIDEWLDRTGVLDKYVVPAIEFIGKAIDFVRIKIDKLFSLTDDLTFPSFDDLANAWGTAKNWISEHILLPLAEVFDIDFSKFHFPTFEEVVEGWDKAKQWIYDHILSPIEETFNFKFSELHFPTFSDIFGAFGDVKDWLHNHVVVPFKDAFKNITGKDIHWPTWDDVKTAWIGFKDWVTKYIIEPIKSLWTSLFGENFTFKDALQKVKDFFTGIGSFVGGLFNNNSANAQITRAQGSIQQTYSFWEKLKAAWTKFAEWVKNYVIEPIKNLWQSIFGEDFKLESLFEKIKNFFIKIGDFIAGLFNGSSNGQITRSQGSLQQSYSLWEDIKTIVVELLGILRYTIHFIAEALKEVGKNENIKKLLAGGFLLTLLRFLSKLFDSLYAFQMSTDWRKAFSEFTESITEGLYGLSEKMQAEAWEKIAKSILMFVASILVLSLLPVDKMKEATSVLVELLLMISVMLVLMSRLNGKMIISRFGMSTTTYGNLGNTILKIGVTVALLAFALKSVAKIGDPVAMRMSLLAVEELLLVVMGMILLLNKQAHKVGSGEKMTTASVSFFAVGIMINALANAVKKFSEIPNFSTSHPAFEAVMKLLEMIVSMVVLTAWLGKTESFGSPAKMTGTVLALAFAIVSIVVVIAKIAKKLDPKALSVFQQIITALTPFLYGLAAILAALALKSKFGQATKVSQQVRPSTILSIGAMIFLVSSALTVLVAGIVASFALIMHEIRQEGFTEEKAEQAVWFLTIIFGFVAAIGAVIGILLAVASRKDMTNTAKAATGLLGISALIFVLGTVISMLSLSISVLIKNTATINNPGTLAVALGGLAIIFGELIALVAVLALCFKSSAFKSASEASLSAPAQFKQYLGLILLLGVMGNVMVKLIKAFSFLVMVSRLGDWKTIAAAGGAITVMLGVMLVALSLVIKMAQPIASPAAGGASQALKLLAIGGLIQTLGGVIVVIALSITMILKTLDGMTLDKGVKLLWNIVGVISVLTSVMVGIFGLVTLISHNNSVNAVGIAETIMGVAIGVAVMSAGLAALTAVVGNKNISGEHGIGAMYAAVGAIALLMGALALLAALASYKNFEEGFFVVTFMMTSIITAAAAFAAAVSILAIALVLLRDAIYDIGLHANEFEVGVNAIINSISVAFYNNFPIILATIISAADLIGQAFIEMLIQAMKNFKQRLPEIVAQLMGTLILLLHSLQSYMGPLIEAILDFLSELLEGLAYAITTQGGKLVAGLLDVIASIFALVTNLLSSLAGVVLKLLGLDFLADFVDLTSDAIASEVMNVMADSGDRIIAKAEATGKRIVAHSPRLAEYYKKYGDAVSASIGNSTDGVVKTVGESGDAVGGAITKAFGRRGSGLGTGPVGQGAGGIASALGLSDSTKLLSYGEEAGINIGDGLTEGLSSFSMLDTLPSMDEYSNYGESAAKAEQDGYTRAFIHGVKTGKIRNVEQAKAWQKSTGASNEFLDTVYDAIENGDFAGKNFQQTIDKMYSEYLDANDTTFEDLAQDYSDKITSYLKGKVETDENGIKKVIVPAINTFQDELGNMEVLGRDYSADAALSVLTSIYAHKPTDTPVPAALADSLWDLRDALGSFAYPEYQEGIKIIDYLLGLSDKPSLEDVQAINKYVEARQSAVERAATAAITEANRQSEKDLIEVLGSSDFTHSGQVVLEKIVTDFNSAEQWAFNELQNKLIGVTDPKRREDLINAYGIIAEQLMSDDGIEYIEGDFANKARVLVNGIDDEIAIAKTRIMQMKPITGDLYKVFEDASWDGTGIVTTFYRQMIVDLAKTVPEAVEEFNTIFGDTIPVLPIDWASIIKSPASISPEAFSYLMSYMYLLGEDVSSQFILGLDEAFESQAKKEKTKSLVYEFADTLPKAAKERLQIESPSKVGEEIGDYFVQGVALGVSRNASLAGDESSNMGVSMWQNLKDAIGSVMGINFDEFNPVIRPVLDLTNVVSGTEQMNSLLSGNVYRRGLGIGSAGYGDINAIAQLNRQSTAQAIRESVLSQPVNQTLNNTFNIQSNDPNEVARRVSAILSNQIERKTQVWGPARVTRATQ